MDNKVLESINKQAEIEGYEPGTELFERRVRQLKVVKCREVKGVTACPECSFFDYCELTKQVMRDNRGI